MRTRINIMSYLVLTILISCKPSFEPIDYGKDACEHCKMSIVDRRYASELVTGKGRAYKFDDIHCLKQYVVAKGEDKGSKYYVADYNKGSSTLIMAESAFFVKDDFFASPMNGHYAAFASMEKAQHLSDSLNTIVLTWDKVN